MNHTEQVERIHALEREVAELQERLQGTIIYPHQHDGPSECVCCGHNTFGYYVKVGDEIWCDRCLEYAVKEARNAAPLRRQRDELAQIINEKDRKLREAGAIVARWCGLEVSDGK